MGFFTRKRILRISLSLIAVLFILALGPLLKIDPSQRKPRPLENPPHVINGAEEILYQPKGTPTKSQNWSFGYIHGFSASKQEIAPVIEDLADYYGAPTYFIRLTGHAIDDGGNSFGESRCLDWLSDADRTVEKAKVSGRNLALIGTSFGGLLATFEALEHQDNIKALILISPMFELPNPIAKFVSGPLGVWFARIILGTHHEFTPKNDLNRKYWTTRYSTKIFPQLMDCENLMRSQDLSKIKIPLLVLYTHKDEVVSVPAIEERFKDFGSTKKFLVEVPGANNHVLSGNVMNPETIPFVEKQIEEFLEKL